MVKSIQHPFNRTTLGEKPKLDTFTVRLNEDERKLLNQAKKDLDIKADSTALKELGWIGLNVLHRTFGKKNLRYLFKKDRQRLSDFENF
jgi:hypothetical protein